MKRRISMGELLIILWFIVVMCTLCGLLLGYLFGKAQTVKSYEKRFPYTFDYVQSIYDENEILTQENIDLMKKIAELQTELEKYND